MSPTSDLSASIVIRAHNEARHIGRLLEGIASQTVKNVEIVVVDSGSTDGTLDIVSKYPHKLVHIPPEKFSFGRALNQGAERASNEFLVLASAHTFPVYDDWIESMLAPFSNEKVALTYGCQRGPPTAPFSEQMLFYQWFPAEAREDQEHPFCNNANAAVRRSAWKDQPYDEELTGLEDLDWAKRAVARGHRIRYVPEATVMHVHEESSKQTYRRYFRESLAMSGSTPEIASPRGTSFVFFLPPWHTIIARPRAPNDCHARSLTSRASAVAR